jgi:hypothetical protein
MKHFFKNTSITSIIKIHHNNGDNNMSQFNIGMNFDTEQESLFALEKMKKLVPGKWTISTESGKSIIDGKPMTIFGIVGWFDTKKEYDLASDYFTKIIEEYDLSKNYIEYCNKVDNIQ